jgi:hypothetical protein
LLEVNSTVLTLLGPIDTFVNSLKVLVGGVFGIYLIILYLRWKEYAVMKRLISDMQRDIHTIAEHQGIKLDPHPKTRMQSFKEHVKSKLRDKPLLHHK